MHPAFWLIPLVACGDLARRPAAPSPAPAVPAPLPAPAPQPAPAPPVPAPAPPEAPPEDAAGSALGAACLAAADCASGVCEGEGCDEASPGVCVAADRRCTLDNRPFCGCDDATFQASSRCPGRRYAHEGACDAGGED